MFAPCTGKDLTLERVIKGGKRHMLGTPLISAWQSVLCLSHACVFMVSGTTFSILTMGTVWGPD